MSQSSELPSLGRQQVGANCFGSSVAGRVTNELRQTTGKTLRLPGTGQDVFASLATGCFFGTGMALVLFELAVLAAMLMLPPLGAVWAFLGFQILLVPVATIVRKFALDAKDHLGESARWVSAGVYYLGWSAVSLGILLAAISAVPLEIGPGRAGVLVLLGLAVAVMVATWLDRRLLDATSRTNWSRRLGVFGEVVAGRSPRKAKSTCVDPGLLFGQDFSLERFLREDAKSTRLMAVLAPDAPAILAFVAPLPPGGRGRFAYFGPTGGDFRARSEAHFRAGVDRGVKPGRLRGKARLTMPQASMLLSTARRFRLFNGQDMWEGEYWVDLPAGERVRFLHCSISPPFSVIPQIEATVLKGKDVRARVSKAYPFGARIELRRAVTDKPERVKIRVKGIASG